MGSMKVAYSRRTERNDTTKQQLELQLGQMTKQEFEKIVDMFENRVGAIVPKSTQKQLMGKNVVMDKLSTYLDEIRQRGSNSES
jgi:hypothetical protein